MIEELEQLRADLILYKQKFMLIEECIYDLQIAVNGIMSTLDDVLDAEAKEAD